MMLASLELMGTFSSEVRKNPPRLPQIVSQVVEDKKKETHSTLYVPKLKGD